MAESTLTRLEYATPRPGPVPDGGRAATGWLFVILLLAGVACPFVAALLAGDGHGWNSAFPASFLAAVTSPLSGVAWAMRRRRAGRGPTLILLATAIAADVTLVSFTRSEGVEYFGRAWSSEPGLMLTWAAAWALWQLVAAASLFRRRAGKRF